MLPQGIGGYEILKKLTEDTNRYVKRLATKELELVDAKLKQKKIKLG